MRTFALAAAVAGSLLTAPELRAQHAVPVPLAERARGAERVVVGEVTAVAAEWQVNEHGDRLIISVTSIAVHETLKGQDQATLQVDLEGGTIGGLTLRVSDIDAPARGDRAVFYLRRSTRGRLVPHLRGQGVLRLDRANRVPGTSLTLDMIRRETSAGRAR